MKTDCTISSEMTVCFIIWSAYTTKPDQHDLREAYGMPANTVKDAERMTKMTTFFFWASWATVTNRVDSDITYTNNWPAEELVGNSPTSALILWTGFSVIILLAGIGLLTWYYVSNRHEELSDTIPATNPVIGLKTFRWGFSGLQPPGWPPDCFLPLPSGEKIRNSRFGV
jgi:nitric oxide reductase large subunit